MAWYRMMGNTDFMFDGPQSRENESYVNDTEQLVFNPPEEFRNSTCLQYFTGRSCYLKVSKSTYTDACFCFFLLYYIPNIFISVINTPYKIIMVNLIFFFFRRFLRRLKIFLRFQGDLEGSILAYEIGLTIHECCFINMKAMFLHELGFMYAIHLDWMVSCRKFAYVAGDNIWLRPYHYFMATGKTNV